MYIWVLCYSANFRLLQGGKGKGKAGKKKKAKKEKTPEQIEAEEKKAEQLKEAEAARAADTVIKHVFKMCESLSIVSSHL